MHTPAPLASMTCVCMFALAAALPACGKRDLYRQDAASFRPDTPFSAKVAGRGEDVCWSVKRALLTQGYMLERGGEGMILAGTKEMQPDEETNISLRLQATCLDNRDGSSTVFATATRETSKVQRVGHSASIGASIATLSLPSGTDRALRVQRRETIQDPKFYQGFYALVQRFAKEEGRSK
jgi:hypothetical protein